MDKVEEFINQEETLKAMVSSRQPQETALEKKKKKFKKTDIDELKSVKKFQDYNFTPLSTRAAEVLMEIKKDPKFHRPSKILSNTPPHNKDKYCDFHKAAGHYTEGCIALRLLIKKFVKNWKFVRFLESREINWGMTGHWIIKTINPKTTNLETTNPWSTNLETVNPRTILPWHDDRGRDNVPQENEERRDD
jgi:superfamily I DNA and/or RNA helicase